MDNFNPNAQKPPKLPKWAAYVPDRRPKFKVYTQRGHALNASHYRANYVLYEYIDDIWVEKYRIDNGVDTGGRIETCYICEKPLFKHMKRYDPEEEYDRFTGYYHWIHDPDTRRIGICSNLCTRFLKGK